MRDLIRDFHQTLRSLWSQPGPASAALLTLALGIGATTAIFSVVDAVLLRPLPFPEPERLADVLAVRPQRGEDRVAITPADFLAWREQSSSFEHLGPWTSPPRSPSPIAPPSTGRGGSPPSRSHGHPILRPPPLPVGGGAMGEGDRGGEVGRGKLWLRMTLAQPWSWLPARSAASMFFVID